MVSERVVTQKGFSRRFNRYYESNSSLQKQFKEGEKYSRGEAYIVGSQVYGFFTDMTPRDTDLLLERPRAHEDIKHLDDFAMGLTRFASFYIEVDGSKVDLIYLSSIFPNKPKSTVEDFFGGNIYNIQNFAYSPHERKIICNDAGLDAVNSRVLRFQNIEAAEAVAHYLVEDKKNMGIEEMLIQMIKEKSGKLTDFKYELPGELRS